MGIVDSSLSFFWLDEGVDTGDLILQLQYKVRQEESIDEINNKVNNLAYLGSKKLCKLLLNGLRPAASYKKRVTGNIWRKRDFHDVIIDCRMSSKAIIGLVKSYSPPYPCAKLLTERVIIDIVDAKIHLSRSLEKSKYWEPGRILSISKRYIVMKSFDGFVRMKSKEELDMNISQLSYVYPPSKFLNNFKNPS
jgi:methionyl-tRNA formyltransferase